jgi:hypothetical protein
MLEYRFLILCMRPLGLRLYPSLLRRLVCIEDRPARLAACAIDLCFRSDLSGGENPTMLRILAASYAQAGRFSDAVETAQRGLELAAAQNNSVLADTLRAEIELYQNNQPCRIANHLELSRQPSTLIRNMVK